MKKTTEQMLSDLRISILGDIANVIRNIDLYTLLKGKPTNTLSEFRNEAFQVACAAANETTNPDDDTFSEEDAANARKLLDTYLIRHRVSIEA